MIRDHVIKESKRESYIDFLRVFATFCVVILHSYAPYFEDFYIYGTKSWWAVNLLAAFTRWGVPVFFMISGYLLLNDSREIKIKIFIKKRLSKVLIPLAFWSIWYYSNSVIMGARVFDIKELILNFFSNKISYHLWFVYTISGLYLCVPIIKNIIDPENDKKMWYFFGVVFTTTTIFPIISKIVGTWVVIAAPIFNGYLGWFLYGYLINRIDLSKKKRKLIYLLALISGIIGAIGTFMISNYYKIDGFFNGGYQLNTYIITTAVYLFVKYDFTPMIKSERLQSLAYKMGKLSYGVYLIHVLVLVKIQMYLPFEQVYIAVAVYSILTFTLSYLIMFTLYMLFRKHDRIRYLLGIS
ncbi:MAG: acyltransferase family protein [Firmicutes bacterium]|jgi:surface polysaccharide O-acyltransferase-like enzyme|nr:acyltransferase family protein [Bacillota bacterium]